MKCRILMCITAITVFAALAVPVQLDAQHHHYKLVDIGTFGGPTSYDDINVFGNQILNTAGVISSYADTSITDPGGQPIVSTKTASSFTRFDVFDGIRASSPTSVRFEA